MFAIHNPLLCAGRVSDWPQIWFIFFLALLMLPANVLIAQINWTKHENNPVLEAGPPGRFDEILFFHSVFFEDSTYHLYFTGNPGNFGLATSPDGIEWEISLFNPILTENEPGFEGLEVLPYVLKHQGIYKMWFIATDGVKFHTRYATSDDGLFWAPYSSSPVLMPGDTGDWDEFVADVGTVLIENDTTFHMWYFGNNAGNNWDIGYAASTDGIEWVKHPDNPVLSRGEPGEDWDDFFIIAPEVIFDGKTYHMFYTGNSGSTSAIGYATSPDGIEWTRHMSNPVLQPGEPGSWDESHVEQGRVMFDGETFRLWYAGRNGAGVWQIGYATAPLDSPVGIAENSGNVPETAVLRQNYPNPFNPSTTINYSLPKSAEVKLTIFDVLGKRVRALVNEQQSAGNWTVTWDGRNDGGVAVSSGIYLYRMETPGFVSTRKMVMLR